MKIVTFLITLQLATISLSAQSLFELYLMIPNQVALGDRYARESMIENYQAADKTLTKNTNYRLDKVDEKNGFMSVTGNMEGEWEMCYWNLVNKKLIAVYFQECGPVCHVGEFKFFIFQDNQLYEQDIEKIIPGYTSIYKDFFKNYTDQIEKELEEKDVTVTLLFEIPRKGKDIIAVLGNEDSRDSYSELVKGDRMLLKWENGKFTKDKIYWSE